MRSYGRRSGRVGGRRRRSTVATWLTEVDRHEQALTSAQEATDHYRQLAETTPDAHLPDLAAALHTLADCLDDVGRHEQALAAAQEATDHYRQLAETTPDP